MHRRDALATSFRSSAVCFALSHSLHASTFSSLLRSLSRLMVLRKLGYTDVLQSTNGQECIDIYKQTCLTQPDRPIHVILMVSAERKGGRERSGARGRNGAD